MILKAKSDIDAIAERAKAYYFGGIKDELTEADRGRFVMIDANSGAWEVDDDLLHGVDRLRQRVPDAELYTLRHLDIVTFRMPSVRVRELL